jgi:hypothetical protein
MIEKNPAILKSQPIFVLADQMRQTLPYSVGSLSKNEGNDGYNGSSVKPVALSTLFNRLAACRLQAGLWPSYPVAWRLFNCRGSIGGGTAGFV